MAEHDMYKLASSAMSGGDEKPKKEIDHIRIRKDHTGHGHIIEHHHKSPEHHPKEEHVTKGTDDMINHVMENMTPQNPGEEEADAGQSGIPQNPTPGTGAAGMSPTPQVTGV